MYRNTSTKDKTMPQLSIIFSLAWMLFACSVSSESDFDNISNGVTGDEILKKTGDYSSNQHYPNNDYQYYNAEQNSGNYQGSNDIAPSGSSDSYPIERQDEILPEGAAAILAIGAAIGAAAALAWNTQQASNSDLDKLKTRVTSLETDQTSICTQAKALGAASSGLTLDGSGYTTSTSGAFEVKLAAISSPTCS